MGVIFQQLWLQLWSVFTTGVVVFPTGVKASDPGVKSNTGRRHT